MTPNAVAGVVARLFAASGRHYGEVELEVYAEALSDLSDELGVRAARDVVRSVDMGLRAPSPHLVIEAAARLREQDAERARDNIPAIEESTGPYLSVEENMARLRAIAPKVCKRVPS